MVTRVNSITSGGLNIRFRTLSTKVRQSAPECEIVHFNVEKVQKTIEDSYCLVIIIKIYCINKVICILLGFDYFNSGISSYIWRCLLTLIVSTTSIILVDSAKQTGLVGCSGS